MSEPLLDSSALELEVTDDLHHGHDHDQDHDHDHHHDHHHHDSTGSGSGSGSGSGAVHAHGAASYQVLSHENQRFDKQPQPPQQPQQQQHHEILSRPTSTNGTGTAIDPAGGLGLGLGLGFDEPHTQQQQQQQQRAISAGFSASSSASAASSSATSISPPAAAAGGLQTVGLSPSPSPSLNPNPHPNVNPADTLAGLSTAEIDAQFQALPGRMRADIEQQLTLMPDSMRQQMRLNMIRQAAIWKQKPDEALLFSVKRHNLPLVKMLIEEFLANPNALDADGNNGLHWATWYKNAGITEYLLSVRCSVHHANPKMQLPIHWACMGGDLQCIRALVNAGATISAQDKDGYYPVHCCAQHGNTTALDYLKLVGADIQALDYNNRTPLHWAAFKNELITTTWLVQQGLELSAKDTGGRTPLHWAASQNNQEIVSYLIGEMETTGEMDLLKLKDDTDMTPLELAEKKESRAVAKYLHDVEKRESSQFWRIWQKAFCMTNKKTSRALQSGRNISVWLALLVAWSVFDHAIWVYSRTPSVSTAAHWAIFIGVTCMVLLWLKTHLTNPGFLPKSGAGITNRDTPANAVISVRPDDDEKSGMLSADSLDEGSTIASLTYEQCLEKGLADAICVTCRITRPLRAKHCRHCDRCVTRFDHHCPWVNTCVGGGNHFWFVWFLIFCIWTMILYVAVHIKYLQEPDNKSDIWRYVVEIPVLGHHMFMVIYVLLLLSQQATMIFSNLTTNEKINSYRYAYLRSGLGEFHNPFDQGALGNCLSFCWLKPEKQVPHLQQYYSQPPMLPMGGITGRHGGHGHSHGGAGGAHGGHGLSHGGGGHGHSH